MAGRGVFGSRKFRVRACPALPCPARLACQLASSQKSAFLLFLLLGESALWV
jgi:hypothetical protein